MANLLSSWINSRWLDETGIEQFKKRFSGALPYSHGILTDFLREDTIVALFTALTKEAFIHKECDLFSLSQTADFSNSDNELLKKFYLFASSKEFASFMQRLTGLTMIPGALDLAGSLYASGDYLLCHDDRVEDRKIAYVLYLSKDFEKKDGAEFVVFNHQKKRPTTIAYTYPPLWNSLMVFEVSPVSFHMVAENLSSKKRYAIGGWLH